MMPEPDLGGVRLVGAGGAINEWNLENQKLVVPALGAKFGKTLLGGFRVVYPCPRCKRKLETENDAVAGRDKCPHCGASFVFDDIIKEAFLAPAAEKLARKASKQAEFDAIRRIQAAKADTREANSRSSQTVQAGEFFTLPDFVERRPLVAVLLIGVGLLGFWIFLLAFAEWWRIATDAAATAGSPQVKAGGEYVVFNAEHVRSRYNLDEFKLTRIQVWNFGEIDLVEVDNQQNERSGEVRDGKIIAKNAETEIRKPVKIPHLTPGVFVGFEKSLGGKDGVWIDFGDIQVCFEDRCYMKHWKRKTGVLADGEGWEAETLVNADFHWIRVRVRVADKNGGQKWDTWHCRFRDKQKTALSDKPSGFLVYKGGIRRDEKKVEELKERRASGRVVE